MTVATACAIFDHLLGAGWREAPLVSGNRRVRCPLHDDMHPSFDVDEARGLWFCRAEGIGGGAVELAHKMLSEDDARALFRELGDGDGANGDRARSRSERPPPCVDDLGPPTTVQFAALKKSRRIREAADLVAVGARLVSVWGREWLGFPTLDPESWRVWGVGRDGRPRYDEKRCAPAACDALDCDHTPKRKLQKRTVNHVSMIVSPAVRDALEAGRQIEGRLYDVEGESDALACIGAGIKYVIASTGGAGALAGHERHRDRLQALAPAEVIAPGDLDDAGRKGADKRAAWWTALGTKTRVLKLPAELGPKGDVRNYLLGCPAMDENPEAAPLGTAADLEALADATPEWRPSAEAEDDSTDANGASRARAKGSGGPGILMCDVRGERVRWLWNNRIPLGKVTLLEGDPDEGKSSLALDLAARVSTGSPMPFDSTPREPAGVVILSAEDGLGDTIRPRLEAAGADLARILAFGFEELPEIPAGLNVIEAAIVSVRAALVLVDPVMAFLADHVESHRDHHIRRALAPLAGLAQRTEVAMMAIRHLNKSGGSNAKYRGGGSIGITGAARSVMLAAPDPDDPTRKILARVKGNLAQPWPAIAYRLLPAGETVRVEWIEETAHTANGLLAVGEEEGDGRSALDEAKRLLADQLEGGPVEAKAVKAELTKAGIAARTLDRAKAALGVRASKSDFGGPWVWSLPNSGVLKSAKNAEER